MEFFRNVLLFVTLGHIIIICIYYFTLTNKFTLSYKKLQKECPIVHNKQYYELNRSEQQELSEWKTKFQLLDDILARQGQERLKTSSEQFFESKNYIEYKIKELEGLPYSRWWSDIGYKIHSLAKLKAKMTAFKYAIQYSLLSYIFCTFLIKIFEPEIIIEIIAFGAINVAAMYFYRNEQKYFKSDLDQKYISHFYTHYFSRR